MGKYIKGKQITSITELENLTFIYVNHKVYHKGWWQSWQYRNVVELIKRGKVFYALKRECEEWI